MEEHRHVQQGVDPNAATLHVPESLRGATAKTLVDQRRRKEYSGPKRVPPRPVDARTEIALGESASFHKRYKQGRKLGEGSMGAVVLAHDARVGREVALKRLHPEYETKRPDLRDRFLREARVQGQLEHPSVVPVYDIGVDSDGHVYFSMKRVRGRTLEEVVQGLRDGDPEICSRYTRRKLLTALSRICLCVAFAHERGVVHRDLKPSNIMLGEYGEVHLLDWGIAKIEGLKDPAREQVRAGFADAPRTEAGFVVGTPGYMAPEQARGELDSYGGRSDIYSLGAILFEAVTLQRLHDHDEVENILLSTVAGVEARPSVRAPHRRLPRELDHICAKACALNPEARYASAREMNDDLEAVLDGDRDSTMRAEFSAHHTQLAKQALERARAGGAQADGQHRRAVGELLQALALQPDNAEARATMVRLLLEPIETLPREAFEELQEVNRQDRARASRANAMAYLAWCGVLPLILWMGVRDWQALGTLGAGVLTLVAYTAWMARSGRTQPQFMIVAVLITFAVIGGMSVFFGPLLMMPAVVVTAATSYLVAIRANRRARAVVMAGSLGAVLVPAVLQLTGVVAPSYSFEGGAMHILPGVTELPARATWTFLLVTNALTVVMANLLVGRAVGTLLRAERRLFTQAWRLRQFLPELSEEERRRAHEPAE